MKLTMATNSDFILSICLWLLISSNAVTDPRTLPLSDRTGAQFARKNFREMEPGENSRVTTVEFAMASCTIWTAVSS